MAKHFHILTLAVVGICCSQVVAVEEVVLVGATGAARPSAESARKKIDELVDKGLARAGLRKNAEVNDEVFVRRIYLDIAGRVPTYDESKIFLESKEAKKRERLIEQLLQSEGYVSHHFHFWADLLRVKTRNRNVPGGVAYTEWIKQALRDNKPYDQFVRELVTSEGYPWDNPAVGYYMRDQGMPLDHMSNTIQVFLGTRMQCAQCHNHPFDTWTQKQYYQLAAYSYGVNTTPPIRELELFGEFQKAALKDVRGTKKAKREAMQKYRRSVRDVFQPARTAAIQTDRELKLPKDYQYNDARPKETMDPKVPFGPVVASKISRSEHPVDAYADWMTSTENPRFTKVIANRLWKKAMGWGLIEPVDDLKEDTQASNPELMNYLEHLMVASKYDMKFFLQVVYSSRSYQSEASNYDESTGAPFHFEGPKLRRMTAEQLWDSVLVLSVPDLDERPGRDRQVFQATKAERTFEKRIEFLNSKNGKEVLQLVKGVAEVNAKYTGQLKNFQAAMKEASSKKEQQNVRKKFGKIRRDRDKELNEILLAGEEMQMMTTSGGGNRGAFKETDPRWKAFNVGMVRASKIVSPAPPGHFLRQFGQSDREVIDNSHHDASVPQALTLMNGHFLWQTVRPESELAQNIKASGSPEERVDVVFLTMLSREPGENERGLALGQIEQYGEAKGLQNVVWALLNSQEFRFIQ